MRFDLITANVESLTGRIYPMSVVKQIAKTIAKNRSFVLLGAPETSMDDIGRICARMEDPVIANGTLSVEVCLVDSPMGALAKSLLDTDKELLNLRVSGSGSIKNKRISDYNFHCAFFETTALTENTRPKDEENG